MGKLETYHTKAEKTNFFNLETIKTKQEFDQIVDELCDFNIESNRKKLFRGVSSSAYKLYTSGQRLWLTKELSNWSKSYQVVIRDFIENAKSWNNNLLDKFYESFGHKPYDLAVLSFLQHYQGFTPLLDFSYNFNIGLYFCLNNAKDIVSSDSYIDNFASLYVIDLEESSELDTIERKLFESINQINKIKKEYPEVSIEEVLDELFNKNLDTLFGLELLVVDDLKQFGIPIYSHTNFNIISQEGAFIFNHSSNLPLEEIFTGLDEHREGVTFILPKIRCLDIHINLKDYALEYLHSKGIVDSFVFPQEEELGKDSYKNFLKA